MKRSVFFISDGTGLTAEALGRSLLTQFEGIEFEEITIPYVNTLAKVEEAKTQINRAYQNDGQKPLVFSTFVNDEIHTVLAQSNCLLFDFFKAFLDPLESELKVKSSHSVGKMHSLQHNPVYNARIEAMNFALNNDDGANIHDYNEADVVLIGVSRCAKTPTSLYLAMQFGIFAANYPFTEDDINNLKLPDFLQAVKAKLFGLTIDPKRLHLIRSERRPKSQYASIAQCEREVHAVEQLFKRENIPFISSTSKSIEEIATTIINTKHLKRRYSKF